MSVSYINDFAQNETLFQAALARDDRPPSPIDAALLCADAGRRCTFRIPAKPLS